MRWTIFDGIPEAETQRVQSIARRRTSARGEVVFHHDDPADTAHPIERGRFAVRVRTALGDSAILTVLGPGDLFGEVAPLGPEQRRTATVESLEAGEIRSILRDDLEALRRSHPGVGDVWRDANRRCPRQPILMGRGRFRATLVTLCADLVRPTRAPVPPASSGSAEPPRRQTVTAPASATRSAS